MKKKLVVAVILIVVSSFYVPQKNEAIGQFLGMVAELLCEECGGSSRRSCCERYCYDTIFSGTHTDNYTEDKWNTCVNNCVVELAAFCQIFY